jgi:tetratricopeptide (TPR) repeat protein
MKIRLAAGAACLLLTAFTAAAQKPKTQKELEALQKVQAAQQSGNADAELAAVNYVLENFADTEFKPQLMAMALGAAEQKGDYALVVTWAERVMALNPNDIPSRVSLAEATARHTRENDLDKADSIKKIQDTANKALDLLKAATAPPAGVPDAAWPDLKKQLTAQSYDALGQAASLDKKYPDAITQYKAGLAADPSAVLRVRLAKAYVDNKQYDEAIATADLVINDASAQPVVKQAAQSQKDVAVKLKGTK